MGDRPQLNDPAPYTLQGYTAGCQAAGGTGCDVEPLIGPYSRISGIRSSIPDSSSRSLTTASEVSPPQPCS